MLGVFVISLFTSTSSCTFYLGDFKYQERQFWGNENNIIEIGSAEILYRKTVVGVS